MAQVVEVVGADDANAAQRGVDGRGSARVGSEPLGDDGGDEGLRLQPHHFPAFPHGQRQDGGVGGQTQRAVEDAVPGSDFHKLNHRISIAAKEVAHTDHGRIGMVDEGPLDARAVEARALRRHDEHRVGSLLAHQPGDGPLFARHQARAQETGQPFGRLAQRIVGFWRGGDDHLTSPA